MKLKSISSKLSVLTLTGVIALSGAGTAFAADSSNSGQNENGFKHQRVNLEEMSAAYQSALDSLVEEGTITQDQADAITASMPSRDGNADATAKDKPEGDGNRAQMGEHKGPWSQFVSDGAITQDQADAIQAAMKTAHDSDKSMSDVLNELVSDGALTQEQADAITASMPARDGKAAAKIEGTQARGGNWSQQGEHKNPWSELVTDGTITQDQLDAIQEAMKTAHDSDKTMSDILDELVSDGTLTQDQADAITAAMPARDGKAAGNSEGMPEHGKNWTQKGEFKSPWSELVTDGTITQDQADAVSSAIKAAMEALKGSEQE